MKVCIVSFWRNDAERHLVRRMGHLLGKAEEGSGAEVSLLWVTGDNRDDTWRLLRPHAETLRHDTGIAGESVAARRARLAETAAHAFTRIPDDVDYVLLHESDLQSPPDVVSRLLAHAAVWDAYLVAGWPMFGSVPPRFHDTFAYRHLGGRHFVEDEPRPGTVLVEVESFGSVWLAPSRLLRRRAVGQDCVVDLCRQWRAEGHRLWVDSALEIVQPADCWTPA